MKVDEVKKGTIIFCVPIYVGKLDGSEQLETYEIIDVSGGRNCNVHVKPIIGISDPILVLPYDFDLDTAIFCNYGSYSLWAWTCNEQIAVSLYEKFVKNEKIVFDRFWDMRMHMWNYNVDEAYI